MNEKMKMTTTIEELVGLLESSLAATESAIAAIRSAESFCDRLREAMSSEDLRGFHDLRGVLASTAYRAARSRQLAEKSVAVQELASESATRALRHVVVLDEVRTIQELAVIVARMDEGGAR